jgi:homoserine O-acetyltransferase
VDTDILYPAREVYQWVDAYRAAGANAEYREIASIAGHDAFLIEWEQVGGALNGGKR